MWLLSYWDEFQYKSYLAANLLWYCHMLSVFCISSNLTLKCILEINNLIRLRVWQVSHLFQSFSRSVFLRSFFKFKANFISQLRIAHFHISNSNFLIVLFLWLYMFPYLVLTSMYLMMMMKAFSVWCFNF